MRASLRLCNAVQARKPSIHFLGKRTPSRSSFLPIRSMSSRSQPPSTSYSTSQTNPDTPPTSPTRDAVPHLAQNGPPRRSPNAPVYPSGYTYVSRSRRAPASHRATTLADVLASSMQPPPEPLPQFKPLSSLRPWERAWSGPQWYTPRPPIRPRRRRSKTAMATSWPKSKLPSNDDPDPVQLPMQVELSPQQRRVLALKREARRRVDRIMNFGRHLYSTGTD